jgi:hypothetical protein
MHEVDETRRAAEYHPCGPRRFRASRGPQVVLAGEDYPRTVCDACVTPKRSPSATANGPCGPPSARTAPASPASAALPGSGSQARGPRIPARSRLRRIRQGLPLPRRGAPGRSCLGRAILIFCPGGSPEGEATAVHIFRRGRRAGKTRALRRNTSLLWRFFQGKNALAVVLSPYFPTALPPPKMCTAVGRGTSSFLSGARNTRGLNLLRN